MRVSLICVICLALAGCNDKRKSPPPPSPTVATTGTLSARPTGLNRDENGKLVPRTPRPADDPAAIPPAPASDIDWDLDKIDPPRDYVERYVRATKRYGSDPACVVAKTNGSRSGKSVVEVRGAGKDGCAPPGTDLRDAFLVDVAADRLERDGGGKLGKWPDETDPAAPAGKPFEPDAFTSPVKDVLLAMQLTPVRAQLYGRGSYLVVTLAGWRDPIAAKAAPASMLGFADKICAASGGLPAAFFAGIDRSLALRVRCSGNDRARWDRL